MKNELNITSGHLCVDAKVNVFGKAIVVILSVALFALCLVTINTPNKAHAAVSDVNLTTLTANATAAADSGTDCATSAPCWSWAARANATDQGTLVVGNAAGTNVSLVGTTNAASISADVIIDFTGADTTVTLPAGETLTIPTGKTLTINKGNQFINNGKIVIESGATLYVKKDNASATAVVGAFNSTSTGSVVGPGDFRSAGAPYATSAYEDVVVNAEVMEMLTFGVNAASVTIPAPILGSNSNVAVSATPLEARVSTNSSDGAKLMIRGSAPSGAAAANGGGGASCTTGTTGFSVANLMQSLSGACEPIVSATGTAPNHTAQTKFDSVPTAARWGYYATTANNTAANTAGTPTAPNLTNLATILWTGVTDADANVVKDGADISGTPASTAFVNWAGPVDYSEYGAMRAFFYFADQITSSTKSGTYTGRVTLTAVPSV